MNSKFKISIPKPCHENWNRMTPKEKGRFCSSCSKTVIDFTKKSTQQIQNYLIENKNKRVCGHFYKKQLDAITIEIPQATFQQQLSFQKLFILALLFVMGTTLFNCQYADGKKQKIENVILNDSILDSNLGLIFHSEKEIDSLNSERDSLFLNRKTEHIKNCNTNLKKDSIINISTIGEVIELQETEGELVIDGDISFTEIEEDYVFGVIIQEPPRFKGSEKLSSKKVREEFNLKISSFFKDNLEEKFIKTLNLVKGKYKIYTQFDIDEKGNIIQIKIRAPHPKLKEKVINILKKLPQFIPGKQHNKVVKTRYSLPISLEVE